MSNHSFVISAEQGALALVGETLELTGAEAHHAVAVKRVSSGEELDLLDGTGLRLRVKVLDASKELLRVIVLERLQEVPPAHRIGLVQALAKGDRDLQSVESAVELGVFTVRPWQADRSIVRWSGSKTEKAMAKWRSLVRSAQKQSRRAFEPEVLEPVNTKTLSTQIRHLCESGELVLILHEAAQLSVAQETQNWLSQASKQAGVTLVVGPEGGISDAELEQFVAAGARPALLGQHVLRASTAGPAALVLVRHLLGEL